MPQIQPVSDSSRLLRTASEGVIRAGDIDGDPLWTAIADWLSDEADRWGLISLATDRETADFHTRHALTVARAWTKENDQ